MADVDILIGLINSVGFPIFVVLWFMFRTEKIIKENTDSNRELVKVVAILSEKLGGIDE